MTDTKKKEWDAFQEWDVITATTDGASSGDATAMGFLL
jgi:hypothetical protein